MIVPPGSVVVAISPEVARLLGELAVAQLKREPQADPDLLRTVEELLSAEVSDSGQEIDQYETVEETGERLGVSARTVRRRCSEGTIAAKRVGNRWLVQK